MESKRAFIALVAITSVISSGSALAALVGFPKAYVLIAGLLVGWIGTAWTGFHWRTWLAGSVALAGALAAASGNYLLAVVCGVLAFLLLFGAYVPSKT